MVDMNTLKCCASCLATDYKMYSFKRIINFYAKLTGFELNGNREAFCFECALMLRKFKKFYVKSLRSIKVLKKMRENKLEGDNVGMSTNRQKHEQESRAYVISSPNYEYFHNNGSQDRCISMSEIFEKKYVQLEGYSSENILINTKLNYEPVNNIKPETKENFDLLNKRDEVTYESNNDELLEDLKFTPKKRKGKVLLKDKKSISKDWKHAIKNNFQKKDSRKAVKLDSSSVSKSDKMVKSRSKFNAHEYEEYLTVVTLTPDDAMKEVELRKESNNFKNCPFKCDFCYRAFEAQTTYDNHMKKHSSEFGQFECEYCHLRFMEKQFLQKHLICCHKRKFYCKICPYICFDPYQARTHVSLHKGKKYPCKECGEVFCYPNSLLMHKRTKHMTECVCELCGSTFATQRGLCQHKLQLHRQEENKLEGPKCSDCGVHFTTETAWKRHLVLSSKHNVSNGCEFCGEVFSNADTLKKHLKNHSRKQWFRGGQGIKLPAACPVCEKWLATRKDYKIHVTLEHPDSETAKEIDASERAQCVCEVCGQTFKKHCSLRYHQRKHTGERPHACKECGKAFATPGALSAHRGAHLRARAACAGLAAPAARACECAVCGKFYATKSALNKHIKAHLGIRPHKCAVCDKAFASASDVRAHIKYVHYKVPWPKRARNKTQAVTC